MIKYYFAKFNSSKHTTITLCLLSHIRSDICVKMVKVGKEREVTLIQIPKSFSLASRRRPSSVVSILPWNVWYRRILHWGYNVLLFKKNKYPHLIKCFVIYTWKSRNDTLTGVLLNLQHTDLYEGLEQTLCERTKGTGVLLWLMLGFWLFQQRVYIYRRRTGRWGHVGYMLVQHLQRCDGKTKG